MDSQPPMFDHQCNECGRRFPRRDQLQRHIRRSHPSEMVKCQWCNYTQPSTDAYRVRNHEKIHLKYINLLPNSNQSTEVPRTRTVIQKPKPYSCTTATPPRTPDFATATTEQLTTFLDQSMGEFSDLIGIEPQTPSPMKKILISASNYLDSPTSQPTPATPPSAVKVPSKVLFKKYLPPTSPISSTSLSQTLSEDPIIDLSIKPSALGASPTKPDNCQTIATKLTTVITTEPEGPQEQPLDLSLTSKGHQIKNIPLQSLTKPIDCTSPRNEWKIIEIDVGSKGYDHLCLDPRVFFAGAPSSYMTHHLAKTLQEKANLSRTEMKNRYQRHLTPVGVKMIIKEEKCYLKDGTVYELRDTWVAEDASTEE